MQSLRVLLIVLLAAVMPLRSAWALGLHCADRHEAPTPTVTDPGAAPGADWGALLGGHPGHDHAGPSLGQTAASAGVEAAPGVPGPDLTAVVETVAPDEGQGPGACPSCVSCCGICAAQPLPAATPQLPPPLMVDAQPFPPLSAPAATHVASGQDRPPRAV